MTDLEELAFWCRATKEQQTIEHKKAIRQCSDFDSIEIRGEMKGMQWTLDIVLAEIKRRLEANGKEKSPTT